MGVDPSRVKDAVATLSGAELDRAVSAADQVGAALSGGDTVTIGATTLIIILLVLIIVLVAD